MEIYPDPIHAALLMLPFFVTMFGLHIILFKPMLAFLTERDTAAERARAEAEALQKEAAEKATTLEARLAEARATATDIRAKARARGLEAETAMIEQARGQADQEVSKALERIRGEAASAKATLEQTATELSSEIAGQVLGRAVA